MVLAANGGGTLGRTGPVLVVVLVTRNATAQRRPAGIITDLKVSSGAASGCGANRLTGVVSVVVLEACGASAFGHPAGVVTNLVGGAGGI